MEVSLDVEQPALAALDSRSRDVLLVVREALSNVERHAQASRCTVSLRSRSDGGVELVVQDDGRGFDPTRLDGGLGVNNARLRAAELGARYAVESSAAGTTVSLHVPVTGERAPKIGRLR